LAEAEWLARRAVDTEDADKQIRQQNWAMPAKNTSERAVDLSIEHIVKRQHGLARRVIPDGVSHVTAAMDLGKYRCHWMVIAWTNSYRGYIIDIGVKEVPKGLPEEKALEIAIREQWDEFQEGYAQEKTPDLRRIDRMIVDSGHSGESVYAVARNFPKRIFPYKGYGESSTNKAGAYHEPKANVKNKDVAKGLQYHITIFQADTGPVPLMHVNADYWKGFCHQRLACAESDPSAVTLYRDDDSKHMDLARHLTAEEQVTEIGIGGREVKTWKVKRRENHWLDCYSMNCALAHTNGSRIHLKPV
jgi:phage terminase large subunit GpA-like protein